MIKILRSTALAAALALGACSNGSFGNFNTFLGGPKATFGGLLGAGAGAFAGSRIGSGTGRLAATAIGALGGAFIGQQIGQSLDSADQAYLRQTTRQALETAPAGQGLGFQNPQTGVSAVVTPVRTFSAGNGAPCREYQTTISVGGQAQSGYGTACRQPDGSWRIAGQ